MIVNVFEDSRRNRKGKKSDHTNTQIHFVTIKLPIIFNIVRMSKLAFHGDPINLKFETITKSSFSTMKQYIYSFIAICLFCFVFYSFYVIILISTFGYAPPW